MHCLKSSRLILRLWWPTSHQLTATEDNVLWRKHKASPSGKETKNYCMGPPHPPSMAQTLPSPDQREGLLGDIWSFAQQLSAQIEAEWTGNILPAASVPAAGSERRAPLCYSTSHLVPSGVHENAFGKSNIQTQSAVFPLPDLSSLETAVHGVRERKHLDDTNSSSPSQHVELCFSKPRSLARINISH